MAHILAVDDESEGLELLERMLRAAGHEVTTAASGQEAITLVRSRPFDLALVDHRIPPPNGVDVLRRILELQPRCIRILISGWLEMGTVMDAINRGEVARVLEKPYEPSVLLDTVNEVLESRHRVEEAHNRALREGLDTGKKMLVDCIQSDAFALALQPIVHADSSDIFAYEALLRSTHDVLNNPALVFEVAKATDMLEQVSEVVAKRVDEWLAKLAPDISLFMNLHPDEFAQPDKIGSTLAPIRTHADRVIIEITERSSVLAMSSWRESVQVIQEMGCGIAVDDIGAGYSSLSVLAALRPQFIKIDMSIVRDIDQDRDKQALVELLSGFAKSTEAQLIAEGVETEQEAQVLKDLKVPLLQGYYFGAPSLEPELLN